ncbi:MAG: hypothetical protein ACRCYZ_01395 [Alphaproteobacteria bacterium]
MKRYVFLSSFILVAALALAACEKKKEGEHQQAAPAEQNMHSQDKKADVMPEAPAPAPAAIAPAHQEPQKPEEVAPISTPIPAETTPAPAGSEAAPKPGH